MPKLKFIKEASLYIVENGRGLPMGWVGKGKKGWYWDDDGLEEEGDPPRTGFRTRHEAALALYAYNRRQSLRNTKRWA